MNGPMSSATTTEELFQGPSADPYTLGVRAYIWGFPLVAAAGIRAYATRPEDPWATRPATAPGGPINRLGHARRLCDHTFRSGVGPNNDTLYSTGWFDLADGPFVITTPDFRSRYYTLSINRADSSADVSVGHRTHGGQLPPLVLHDARLTPDVPDGALPIPCSTRYVLIAGRVLVEPGEDLASVHALQDGIETTLLDGSVPGVSPQRPFPAGRPTAVGADFLGLLGRVLQDWWVRPDEAELIAEFASIGLTTDRGFDRSAVAAEVLTAASEGIEAAAMVVERASRRLGRERSGWTTNLDGPRFGSDHLLRAAVAKDQIYVAVPEEAVFPVGRVDAAGESLTGTRRYRIRFRPGQFPPVRAFWSITMYDDSGFMVDNPIDRFSISDRTPGLVADEDGGLTIAVQHDQPDAGTSNWLPSPPGPHYLMMRLYLPTHEVLSGAWSPPPIERLPSGERGVGE
ncbi:MAG: DUF1214 domain-containing protein [Ilumatobacteraceae bacterium]